MKFHITFELTPFLCKPITKEIVISEDYLDWVVRDKNHHPIQEGNRRVLQYRPIGDEEYEKYKKIFNPRKPAKKGDRYDPPSCRDFLMNDNDYVP